MEAIRLAEEAAVAEAELAVAELAGVADAMDGLGDLGDSDSGSGERIDSGRRNKEPEVGILSR